MKRLLKAFTVLCFLSGLTGLLHAQAPSAIPYQAVARNNSGNLIANQAISVRFSIREASISGAIVYRETHGVITNALGLFTLNIGQGTPVSGTFSAINWGSGAKFTQVEMDAAGGTSYTDMGTQQMLSVPYALYANSGGTPPVAGSGISVSGTTVTNTAPDQTVTLTGSGATTVTGSYPNFTVSSTDANTTYTSGTGINIAGTTINNTAPDQTVTLTGNGATTITGTYPNFTVSSTDANTTYNGGSGINIAGTTINNTAPDQTVTLTGNGATTVTGDYPNFTVSSTDANTTYDAGAGIEIEGATISNTAPDQPVTLTGEGITTVTGDYPDFTISSSEVDPKTGVLTTNRVPKWGDSALTDGILYDDGDNIGIGTYAPEQKLDVNGTTKTMNLQITDGAEEGYILKSDSDGYAAWTNPAEAEVDPKVGSLDDNRVPKWEGSVLMNGLLYDNGERIGINTTQPGTLDDDLLSSRLEIWSEDKGAADFNNILASDGDQGAWINIAKARGTLTTPEIVQSGDNLTEINAYAYEGSRFTKAAGIWMSVDDETPVADNIPTRMTFLTTSEGYSYPEERLTIRSNGNVGIGLTDPTDRLTVDGNIRINERQLYLRNGDDIHHGLGYFGSNAESSWGGVDVDGPVLYGYSGGALGITDNEEQKSVLTWRYDGNVGIGTTSPEERLEVAGATKTTNFQMTDGAEEGYILQSNGEGWASWVDPAGLSEITESDPQVVSSVNNRVPKWNGTALTDGIITDNGLRVGIGTTASPVKELDVNGSINLSSDLYMGNNRILSIAGADNVFLGRNAGLVNSSGNSNVFMGSNAGADNTSGDVNVFVGHTAGESNTEGFGNTFLGFAAGKGTTTGDYNTYVGRAAGYRNTDGIWNIGIGLQTLYNNISGQYNVAIGNNAGFDNTGGNGNTYIGREAGYHNTGSDNVFIGNHAGYNETGSSLLYIDNTQTSSPLIWGNFNSNYVNINGNLGVGTTSPTQAKLVVNGSQNLNLSYGYLNEDGDTGEASGNNTYSIYASHRIAASEFNAYSDARIKNIFGQSDSRSDLQTLLGIEITDYKLKDHIAKGDQTYKKVIAQQIEEVYPQAVSKMTDVVPDIYQLADIREGRVAIANTLKAGEKVKLIFGERTELMEVLDADAQGFKVNLPDEGKVFVYGREVNDFRTVDYEALSTLNISATQELVKMINVQNAVIADLKSDIDQIKTALQLNGGVSAKR